MIYTLGERRMESADEDYYVAPGAQLIGSVRLGSRASVWFNCVLRADNHWIIVGDGSNVQDGTVIHTDAETPVEIGRHVTVGHMAFLHGCSVGDESLIANGALVLDRARIGRHCVIAAGALVPPDKEIPDGSVVMGSPGRIVRTVTAADLAMIEKAGEVYRQRSREYRQLLRADPRGGV